MSESLTVYGKLCRKYRIDRGWTMAAAAEQLGCRQSFLSQIETGKTKKRKTKAGEARLDKVSPNLDFLLKTMDVYQLAPAEKLNFFFKVLMDMEKIEIPLKTSSFRAKTEFIGLLAIFLLNGRVEYPHEDNEVWATVREIYNILTPYVTDSIPA